MRNQHDGNALLLEAMDQAQHLLDLPHRGIAAVGSSIMTSLAFDRPRPRDGRPAWR